MVDASNLLSLPRVRQNYAYFAFFLAITVALLAILGQKVRFMKFSFCFCCCCFREEGTKDGIRDMAAL